MTGHRLALVLLLAAAPSRAEIMSLRIGPVALRGLFHPMMGPSRTVPVRFPRAGWVRGFSVHIADAAGRSADQRGVLCHGVLYAPGEHNAGLDGPDDDDAALARGTKLEITHLSTAEGQNEFTLPDGFGLHVDSSTEYLVHVMLQSADLANDGDYTFTVGLDVVYADEGTALQTMQDMAVPQGRPDRAGRRPEWLEDWSVPPGRHAYSQPFTMPYAATVHYISTHLHQFARRVALVDGESGKVLFETRVRNRKDGWPSRIPVYSDVRGIRLAAGRRYEFRQDYDNPEPGPAKAMSIMRLFFHRDP